MTEPRLTFGASIGARIEPTRTKADVLAAARAAEAAGFDVLTVADHLGAGSPFPLLAVAAAVTERIRLRTYVLDVYFWNPALLAREVATLDALSGGRFELGLGAGHMKHEHDDAGLPFPPLAERAAEVERVLVEVRRRLADPGHRPAPVQHPVPVSIGAWGAGTSAVAARHAEIHSLTGLVQVKGRPPGTFTFSDGAEVDRRVGRLRELVASTRPAGAAEPTIDCLLQQVEIGRDPAEAAAALVAEWAAEDGEPEMSVDDVLASPFLLLAATPDDAVDELHRRHERWGITSWCTHIPSVPALGLVVAAERARRERPGR